MKKSALLLFLSWLISLTSFSQSANAPHAETYYHWLDRWEIRSGIQQQYFHTSFKPYQREYIGAFLNNIKDDDLSEKEKFILDYLRQDNWEWTADVDYESEKSFLKYFYGSKSDFYHVRTDNFDLHINPVIDISGGKELEGDLTTFRNTRGIRIRGVVDDKVAFYTSITENQVRVPYYISRLSKEGRYFPRVGFVKGFKEGGYDYFDARGYISVNATKHINVQLGHDNFKVGNGYRSMLLSDFAPAYFFLKLETRVWKLNYTNLFTEMTANRISGASQGSGNPDKYSVFHHLGIDIGKKLNIGVFEAVIVGGSDTTDADLELEYLNPIIFYRAIEQQNGSSYNALVGADFQWFPVKGVSLYGQIMLDEFLLEHLRSGDGWWGNKFGIQAGAEWVNAFKVPTLDLLAEVNLARPYTYSHYNMANSYSHYLQPLAHPLGANFNEKIFIVRYQPVKKLFAELRIIAAERGRDGDNENWGGEILKVNTTREQELNNKIGQGIPQNISLIVFDASYMLKHNLFINGTLTARQSEAGHADFAGNTLWINAGIRWNAFPINYDF